MLRVFGCYTQGKIPPVHAQKRMESLLGINNNSLSTNLKFSSGSFFLIYEHLRLDAERYYHIDKRHDLACFVVGNIYGYDDDSFKDFSKINIAQWIIRKFSKEKSFAFAKNLRGIFNIILWDKGELYLVNDLLGLSAMYVKRQNQGLFFCNNPEPVIGMSGSNSIDHKSIIELMDSRKPAKPEEERDDS